jgi:hypothetical protein
MKGTHKPFSSTLHSKHDPKSRRLVKDFFAEKGLILIDHNNKFDIDLVSVDGKIRVEVEHRESWESKIFPFTEVNVPERKCKFFEEGNTHYCILSKNYTQLGFIHAKVIRRYMKPKYLKENPNKFIKKNEYFYKIPRNKFEFYEIIE